MHTMHTSFSSELRSDMNRFRSASRCYIQATRSIFITTTYIDSVGDRGEPDNNEGLVLREHKWTTLSHQELGSEGSDRVTRIQTFSTITLEFCAPVAGEPLAQRHCRDGRDPAVGGGGRCEPATARERSPRAGRGTTACLSLFHSIRQ